MASEPGKYHRVLAIGDIHGCAKTFRKLLFEELRITPDDLVICVGDYIDRGPDSKGVVDTILELRAQGNEIITLRGNHEQIMLDSVRGEDEYELWLMNGGEETLNSFGAESYSMLDDQYKIFFETTAFWYEWGNDILVHAGLNFDAADPLSDKEAMLWTRKTDVDETWLNGRIVIHGHTPMKKEIILKQEGQNINIDGGCVYPWRDGMGWMVALDLHSRRFHTVENAEMD